MEGWGRGEASFTPGAPLFGGQVVSWVSVGWHRERWAIAYYRLMAWFWLGWVWWVGSKCHLLDFEGRIGLMGTSFKEQVRVFLSKPLAQGIVALNGK